MTPGSVYTIDWAISALLSGALFTLITKVSSSVFANELENEHVEFRELGLELCFQKLGVQSVGVFESLGMNLKLIGETKKTSSFPFIFAQNLILIINRMHNCYNLMSGTYKHI